MRGIVAGLALASVVGCVKALPPTMEPSQVLEVQTSDGWLLDVRHYPGDGPPVLLVHGMGANHYNFDYREEVSLAHFLQQAGWDVWVPEMRGDPGSEGPSRLAARMYDFDDFARRDLPAAVDGVLAATGQDSLYWVGHSMGGMLLYTAVADYPHKIEAGVAICSPGVFEDAVKASHTLRTLGWVFGGERVLPSRFIADLAGPLGRMNPFYGRIGNKENYDFAVTNGMARHAVVPLTHATVRQVLDWLEHGELVSSEGEPYLEDNGVPVMLMAGSVDRIVAPDDVASTCERYGNCEFKLLGVEGGMSVEYGHIDPVVGTTVQAEVYPLVLDFLERHRGAPASAAVSP